MPFPALVVPILKIIAVAAVSAAAQIFLAPKPRQPKPTEVEDMEKPTAEEGNPIPVVFGEAWLKDLNVLWSGEIDTNSRKIKS